jgi:hypothetical protein
VILPVFKAGDPSLRGMDGGFDSHTLPPNWLKANRLLVQTLFQPVQT